MKRRRLRATLTLLLFTLAVVAGCSRTEPPAPDSTFETNKIEPIDAADIPYPEEPDPVIEEVSQEQWDSMVDAGMVRDECPITDRDQLRRVMVDHYDFEGETQRGEIVVNEDVAESVVRIFTRLWEEEFPIRQMRPLEEFDGDSNDSLAADNTAALNCRRADQINAPFEESPHANGRAIDLNPRENPWMDLRCKCWSPSAEFKERKEGPGIILENGPAWQAFDDEGWIWQNIDVPDYMHFDTGYPSEKFED